MRILILEHDSDKPPRNLTAEVLIKKPNAKPLTILHWSLLEAVRVCIECQEDVTLSVVTGKATNPVCYLHSAYVRAYIAS